MNEQTGKVIATGMGNSIKGTSDCIDRDGLISGEFLLKTLSATTEEVERSAAWVRATFGSDSKGG